MKRQPKAFLPRNDFEGFGHGGDEELFLAVDSSGEVSEMFGDFHFDGASTGDDRVVLHRPSDDHDGVVQRSLSFLHELLCATAKDEGAGLSLNK